MAERGRDCDAGVRGDGACTRAGAPAAGPAGEGRARRGRGMERDPRAEPIARAARARHVIPPGELDTVPDPLPDRFTVSENAGELPPATVVIAPVDETCSTVLLPEVARKPPSDVGIAAVNARWKNSEVKFVENVHPAAGGTTVVTLPDVTELTLSTRQLPASAIRNPPVAVGRTSLGWFSPTEVAGPLAEVGSAVHGSSGSRRPGA